MVNTYGYGLFNRVSTAEIDIRKTISTSATIIELIEVDLVVVLLFSNCQVQIAITIHITPSD